MWSVINSEKKNSRDEYVGPPSGNQQNDKLNSNNDKLNHYEMSQQQ